MKRAAHGRRQSTPRAAMRSLAAWGGTLALLIASPSAPASAMGGGDAGVAGAVPGFIIGADISKVPEQEAAGVRFADVDGVVPRGTTSTGGGVLAILRNHGFNFVRLRLFVDPAAPGGYSTQGYCDLRSTIRIASGVKQAGMGFLLDLHYSDTWADPGHQAKPAAWAQLDLPELGETVRRYTRSVIEEFIAAGARPDMVQIGNEIAAGFLWEDGRVQGTAFGNFAALLQAAIDTVRGVDPGIQIVLHLDRCHDLAASRWWLDGILAAGVRFDILAQSCYDAPGYQQPASAWAPALAALSRAYPDLRFLVAEYSKAKREANALVAGLPEGRGLGAFLWEPTWWGERLFDDDGRADARWMGFYDSLAVSAGRR